MNSKLSIFVGIVGLSLSLASKAQPVPPLINYQGQIADSGGTPLATADYMLTFNIYDASQNGNLIWGPQLFDGQGGQGHGPKIPVVQGYFNVILGPADTAGRALTNAFAAANRYLEITVSNRPPMLPRQQVLSAPYAFKAANADKLAGYDWASLFDNANPQTGSIPAGRLQSGTITSTQIGDAQVSAGKLQDGGVLESKLGNGAVSTRTIQNLAVTSAAIADGAVLTTKIADTQITTPKLVDASVAWACFERTDKEVGSFS